MKRLVYTIIALFAFLIIAFFTESKHDTKFGQKPVVGILQTMSHPALDQIHHGIIKGLKDEGYISTVKISKLNLKMPKMIKAI